MRRKVEVLGILATIAFAFSMLAAASASAARFQSDETGTLNGHALNTQTFTFTGGTAKCTTATTSGSVSGYEEEALKVKVAYSGCTAFGKEATVSAAEFELHASGTVDLINTVTISVAGCSVKVGSQSGLKSVSYENQTSTGKLVAKSSLSSIVYTTSGEGCGIGGSNGSFSGNSELELNEGANTLEETGGPTLSKKVMFNGAAGPCTKITKVGDKCEIEFTVTGAGAGWMVEKNVFAGTNAAIRYTSTIGCPAKTLLEQGKTTKCTDIYTVQKFEAGGFNDSCVTWEPPPGSGLRNLKFCTDLMM